jgi:hypothetical protein
MDSFLVADKSIAPHRFALYKSSSRSIELLRKIMEMATVKMAVTRMKIGQTHALDGDGLSK